MSVINISSNEQFNSILTSSRFVVADCKFNIPARSVPTPPPPPAESKTADCDSPGFLVYADWCGPCKAIAPVYDSLARQLSRPNHIAFTKINGDEQQEIAGAYSVRAYVDCPN